MKTSIVSLIAILILTASTAFAQSYNFIPLGISYQGMLKDSQGRPVADGTHPMRFYIYDDSASGTLLWRQPADGAPAQLVETNGGYFTVALGTSGHEIFSEVINNNPSDRWLQVEVAGEFLEPRVRLFSTPFAYRSIEAQTDHDWDKNGEDVYKLNGKVGIGTNLPWSKLTVNGVISSDLLSSGLDSPAFVYSHDGIKYFTAYVQDGSDFKISRHDDNGNFINAPLSISRLTGDIILDYGILYVDAENDRVGIGIQNPTEAMQVNGVVNSTSGGFKFPDSTIQTTASRITPGHFPAPAWDSGWLHLNQGEAVTLTHGLGGDVRNYFVDLQQYEIYSGYNNRFNGLEYYSNGETWYNRGAYYSSLNSSTIQVLRGADDSEADSLRVRIWVVD